MKISVLVPTYRRSKDLERCLDALKKQSVPADEVLVVVRDTDKETHQFLGAFATGPLPLKIVDVIESGQVAALNAGLAVAIGEIISITDDDAAPHPDWLKRIEEHFLVDDRVGGVGGRDITYISGVLHDASVHPGASNIVGKLEWFGRTIGNHHIGSGPPREVDILKGANMSYRRIAISDLYFDKNLRGLGAQVHNDLGFSLSVKQRGWKLIYDPMVQVDHYLGARFESTDRLDFNHEHWLNSSFNETLIILDSLSSVQRCVYILWAVLIGSRSSFGLVQMLRFTPKEKHLVFKKFNASIQGRWQGYTAWRRAADT
jgi:glycosyltransferase involved in cell wall biosynthesis